MQTKETYPVQGKCKRMGIIPAIGVIFLTMLGMVPVLLAFNETEFVWSNFIGGAYLGAVLIFLHTKRGMKWTDLVSRANDRIFGEYAPSKCDGEDENV